MPTAATIYPIYSLADDLDGQPFDRSALPFQIVDGAQIENVSTMFNDQTFNWVQSERGRVFVQDLRSTRFAIVHRYQKRSSEDTSEDDESEKLVRNLAACLRLIRPMRQRSLLMRGEIENGLMDIRHFEHPVNLMEVPEVQKLFALRNSDADLLRTLAPEFLRAMDGKFWKFRMAVEFHEAGHFQDRYWKARYSLWCSALEAIYTSNSPEHRGSLVAKERIKWYLGEETSIYSPGDFPSFQRSQPIKIGEIVEDLYTIRNLIAHGDRIPERYYQQELREGLNGPLNVPTVLLEAVSFIVRQSLIQIIQRNLLDHFADASQAEAYFARAGLTNNEIKKRLGSV